MSWANHDETQPIPRLAGSETHEVYPPEPEKAPPSAQEPPAGTRARPTPHRRSEPPRSATTGHTLLRATGRVALAPARAVADRWDDIWPPAVGIFFGCLAGGTALVLIFTFFINWIW